MCNTGRRINKTTEGLWIPRPPLHLGWKQFLTVVEWFKFTMFRRDFVNIESKRVYLHWSLVVRCLLWPLKFTISKTERCYLWFLNYIFHFISFAHSIYSLWGFQALNSVEYAIDMIELQCLGHLSIEPKMAVAVRNLLKSRSGSFLYLTIAFIGTFIWEPPQKYDLFKIVVLKLRTSYEHGLENNRIRRSPWEAWKYLVCFCFRHPDLKLAKDCLENVLPYYFWSEVIICPICLTCLKTYVSIVCDVRREIYNAHWLF